MPNLWRVPTISMLCVGIIAYNFPHMLDHHELKLQVHGRNSFPVGLLSSLASRFKRNKVRTHQESKYKKCFALAPLQIHVIINTLWVIDFGCSHQG